MMVPQIPRGRKRTKAEKIASVTRGQDSVNATRGGALLLAGVSLSLGLCRGAVGALADLDGRLALDLGRGGRRAALGKALLQRVHQIDDLGARGGRLGDGDLLALDLGV